MTLNYVLARNDWESDFFQREIARLTFTESAVSQPHFGDFVLIQCKLDATQREEMACLHTLGFEQVEGECDYCWPLTADAPTALCLAREQDIPALEQLVAHTFADSRFRAPWFSTAENARFYQCWIAKAVRGQFDDACLVLKTDDGQIQGAISVRMLDDVRGRVGLLAVNAQFQGQGVAQQLLAQAKSWCLEKGVRQLWIATQQSNLAANRLYQKIGAEVHARAAWFYKQIK
ncbi:dTDP-4-amino-4,6-dideoxy-D-galactose acyltransferase [Pasteurellaceae bacterium TAE3-ERU1]|nr:dTDP-4-amino-4,6-dideoxy-D-galactose acyltransferase [Pasteurellaceae bacterium TAE3-ERU1]